MYAYICMHIHVCIYMYAYICMHIYVSVSSRADPYCLSSFPILSLSRTPHRGQLEVDPGSLSSLSISLPKAFLGDKRTAYSQHLTFNLSIPDMVPGDSCHVFVEVVGRLSRYRQVKLVAELPVPESEPTVIEVCMVCVYVYMCMYACVYVCVYMYVCICMCVCMYVHDVCMYACVYVCICMCVCMYMMCVCMLVCMCVYVCVYVCLYVGVYVCMCIWIYVCVCTCTCQ